MDLSLFIRQRLTELGTGQKGLAAAAQVTESYVSQLLTGKKAPPAPSRTDIYERMETFLRLSPGNLSTLAAIQRQDALKRKLADPPAPLFKEVRELVLGKCPPSTKQPMRAVFEREPFGALERLVTRTILDVVKRVTKKGLEDENWLRLVAPVAGRSYEHMRVMALEFLDTDIFDVSAENCVTFLDPLIDSWDIDLSTFGMQVVLNRRLAPDHLRTFEFAERKASPPVGAEPGFEAFIQDPLMRGDATTEEIEFLEKLRFSGKRPTALYYYRALQNLRDPLHFG